ncbi:MAG TPA: tetratricopeptide repeat protein, partial [Thermoanaerobaculia bacterium]|nr:tetratricopeptide repeat protein [Thermoanaerobaculia bacterium]
MLRKIRFRVLAPAVAVLLLLTAPVRDETVLKAGSVLDQDLSGGQVHVYRLEGQAGQNLLVTVLQDGVDVTLSVHDSGGESLGTMDAAEDRHGLERWLLSTDAGEAFRIEVRSRSSEAPPGRYQIEVKELPAAAPELAAERSLTEADLLASQEAAEPRRQAIEVYRRALGHWRELGRKPDEARTLLRLAVAHQELGESQPMQGCLAEALLLFTALHDREGEGDTLNFLGLAQGNLGRFREALASYERSLEIRRNLGDRHGEAITSQNVCLTRLHLGQCREAIPCYEKTILLLEEVGAPVAEALNGLGGAYHQLGEPRKA